MTDKGRGSDARGLTAKEAAERLAADGPNELPAAVNRDIKAIAFGVVRDPTFVLLLIAGAIYLVLGDWHEAILLLSFVVMIVGITVYQEDKTERALHALRELTSPRALVVRDGTRLRIAGRDVVRGDVLVVSEGDRVPADAALLVANDMMVDESLLTGESIAVRKSAWDGAQPMTRPGGDGLPFIYSGTMITRGQGVAVVLLTGAGTGIGGIGAALSAEEPALTPLQQQTQRMIRRIAAAAIVLAAMLVVLYGSVRGGWLDAILAGITLAMAILPQEFPVVLTVFLALGAWRISRQRVLTRRIPAIETLGAATVLCVDKTGTLTLNRMAVRMLFAAGEAQQVPLRDDAALPAKFHAVVEFGILASEIDPFDPMERALHEFGSRVLPAELKRHETGSLVREYPISPALLAHGHGWSTNHGSERTVAAKGAPEAIAGLCHLPDDECVKLELQVAAMAESGLRVLGVARARNVEGAWPDALPRFDFEFLGLIGLADPVRPTVAAALADCYSAGMRVVMITGDYAGTARAIAREIGLAGGGEVLTGADLEAMDENALQLQLGRVNIFARVVPAQKLRLVNALKARGEVVAMTGDGVNDAPALKAANIGIAMGARGTDVAREAASLVLLDDDFASIVHTVRLGRRIYDNIVNAMCYLLAVHVPIAGMSLLPLVFGWPLVLFPAHIVFLEFVINPACSIAFEAEEADSDVMRRPPRAAGEALFGGWLFASSLVQGCSMLAAVAAVFGITLANGGGEGVARAMAFTTIVFGNLGLIIANRSRTQLIVQTLRRPNSALWWVIGATLAGVMLVLYVPDLRSLFRFAPLHGTDVLVCAIAAAAAMVWFELSKLYSSTRLRRASRQR